MLRDNLVGLIEPMPTARENDGDLLSRWASISRDRHRTIDTHALKIPAPQGRNLH
jgi:hypothetical protein